MIKHHGANIKELIDNGSITKEKILDFSSNTNAFIDKDKIAKILAENLNEVFLYPDYRYKKALEKLSEEFDVESGNLMLCNGATEAIYLFFQNTSFKNTFITVPNFSEYEYANLVFKKECNFIVGRESANFKILTYELKNYNFDKSVLVITNPNNPVGYTYTTSEIKDICNFLRLSGSYLLLDESFIGFSDLEGNIELIKKCDNLVIIKSFTKEFCLPGIRTGVIIGNKKIISRLKKVQPTWNINSFAMKTIEEFKFFKNLFLESYNDYLVAKNKFIDSLSLLDKLKIFNSNANYFLFYVDEIESEQPLKDYCLNKGVVLRDCSTYKGLKRGYYRVAVLREEDNYVLINLIKSYLNG